MQYRKPMVRVVMAALAVVSLHAAAAAPQYKVEGFADWENFGLTSANAINNLGQATGLSWFGPHGMASSYIYSNGEMHRIDALGRSVAFDINDRGDLVGIAYTHEGAGSFPFLYRDGKVVDVSAGLAPGLGQALAVNQLGHVAGFQALDSGVNRPFFYDGNRSWLMPFEGGFVGINDHDVMITGQGLIYDHGHVSNLPPVQGRDMYYMSRAINNAGQVTGTVVFQDESKAVPFLYRNGTIEILGTLGHFNGYALDLNNKGWVVGESLSTGEDVDAFLFRDGKMYNLEDLLIPRDRGRWDFTSAVSINDQGQILVRDVQGFGFQHAILTPVPESQSPALWLAGLGVMAGVSWKRRRMAPSARSGCSEKTRSTPERAPAGKPGQGPGAAP